MSESSSRKNMMLSLFIGALANMLSSRQKHHSKPPRSYRTSPTSCKLGEGSAWRGPTASFVLHWQNQVRLYEAQLEKEEYFSNGQKRHIINLGRRCTFNFRKLVETSNLTQADFNFKVVLRKKSQSHCMVAENAEEEDLSDSDIIHHFHSSAGKT
jgi:hypothetical protein